MTIPSQHYDAAPTRHQPAPPLYRRNPPASNAPDSDDEWWLQETEERRAGNSPISRASRRSKGSASSGTMLSSKKYSVRKPNRMSSSRRIQKENLRAGMRVVTDFPGSGTQSRKPARHIPVARPPVAPQPALLKPQTALAPEQRQSINGPQTSMSLFFNFGKDQENANAPPVPPVPMLTDITSMEPQGKPKALGQEQKFVGLGDIAGAASGHQRSKSKRWFGLGDKAPSSFGQAPASIKKVRGLGLAPLKVSKNISPSDRDVIIGFGSLHPIGPSGAGSQKQTSPPPTPSMLVTPAKQQSGSHASSVPGSGSSVYSQMTTYPPNYGQATETPPMPRDATHRWVADTRNHPPNRDSEITILEDLSPLTPGSRGSRSVASLKFIRSRSQRDLRLSSDSAAEKTPTGWWSTVLSPYLTRSNTATSRKGFSPIEDHPELPNLERANEIARLEKEKSAERVIASGFDGPRAKVGHETTFTDLADWETQRIAAQKVPEHQNKGDGLKKELGFVGFAPMIDKQQQPSNQPQGKLPKTWMPTPDPSSPPRFYSSPHAKSPDHQFSPGDREVPMLFDIGVTGPHHPPPLETTSTKSVSNIKSPDGVCSPGSVAETPTVHHANIGKLVQARSPFPPAGKRNDSLQSSSINGYPSSTLPPYSSKQTPIVMTAFSSSHAYPQSPSSISPNMRRSIAHTRGEPLSEVPLTPAARSQPGDFEHPSKQWPPVAVRSEKSKPKKKSKMMAKWKKTHPKKKKRICVGVIVVILLLLILSIVLGLILGRKHKASTLPTQWLNLTNFPPIPTGESTIVRPDPVSEDTGCVVPSSMWSCAVPRDSQQSILPNQPNQPNFDFQILYRNDSPNAQPSKRSILPSSLSIRSLLRRASSDALWTATPPPPTTEDQHFIGSTTDNTTSALKEGEPTPFYMTFLTTPSTPQRLAKRDSSPFPDATLGFPPPAQNVDGTPIPASLLPLPVLQPLRLFDRGLPTEHYGFYTYFDRRIFLSSTPALLNASSSSPNPVPITADVPGGSRLRDSRLVCTWSQTRFLVQIWTKPTLLRAALITPENSTSKSGSPYPGQQGADKDRQPGSFPYPVSVSLDRHGGDVSKKTIYCYGIGGNGHVDSSVRVVQIETREKFGVLVGGGQGPDGDKISVASGGLGGIDGGSGGCGCLWRNWRATTSS